MNLSKNLVFVFSFLLICSVCGQEIKAVSSKSLDLEFRALADSLGSEYEKDDLTSIRLSLEALESSNDRYARFNLIFWELAFHYANLGQYKNALEILKKGQQENMFFWLHKESFQFPPFLPELEKLDGYDEFYRINNELKDSANKKNTAEYMVQLPENYLETKKYPLLIVLHGGGGSIPGSQYYYDSKFLRSEFIVAYFQGETLEGLFTRKFAGNDWQETIEEAYSQIKKQYSVDASKVLLTGMSAGGLKSIVLGKHKKIPAKGVSLAFPVIPEGIEESHYKKWAQDDFKVAQVCGEDDWAFSGQKKFFVQLEKYGVKNRFLVFPELGHDFPKDFSRHMDTSLSFLLE